MKPAIPNVTFYLFERAERQCTNAPYSTVQHIGQHPASVLSFYKNWVGWGRGSILTVNFHIKVEFAKSGYGFRSGLARGIFAGVVFAQKPFLRQKLVEWFLSSTVVFAIYLRPCAICLALSRNKFRVLSVPPPSGLVLGVPCVCVATVVYPTVVGIGILS